MEKQEIALALMKDTAYLTENYWYLIKTNNTKRKLNQTAFYEKVTDRLEM